jgi:hypothetical protein
MKKAILTVGLFSLMMVLTSFTSPEIGGGTKDLKPEKKLEEEEHKGQKLEVLFMKFGGGTQGSETRKEIEGEHKVLKLEDNISNNIILKSHRINDGFFRLNKIDMFVKNNRLKQTNVILSFLLLFLSVVQKETQCQHTGAITVEALLDSAGSTNKTKEQKVEFYLQAYGIIQKRKERKENSKPLLYSKGTE